jgi:hypothetical protein
VKSTCWRTRGSYFIISSFTGFFLGFRLCMRWMERKEKQTKGFAKRNGKESERFRGARNRWIEGPRRAALDGRGIIHTAHVLRSLLSLYPSLFSTIWARQKNDTRQRGFDLWGGEVLFERDACCDRFSPSTRPYSPALTHLDVEVPRRCRAHQLDQDGAGLGAFRHGAFATVASAIPPKSTFLVFWFWFFPPYPRECVCACRCACFTRHRRRGARDVRTLRTSVVASTRALRTGAVARGVGAKNPKSNSAAPACSAKRQRFSLFFWYIYFFTTQTCCPLRAALPRSFPDERVTPCPGIYWGRRSAIHRSGAGPNHAFSVGSSSLLNLDSLLFRTGGGASSCSPPLLSHARGEHPRAWTRSAY